MLIWPFLLYLQTFQYTFNNRFFYYVGSASTKYSLLTIVRIRIIDLKKKKTTS